MSAKTSPKNGKSGTKLPNLLEEDDDCDDEDIVEVSLNQQTPGGSLALSALNLGHEPGTRHSRAFEGIHHTVSGCPHSPKSREDWRGTEKSQAKCFICKEKFLLTGSRKRTFCRRCGKSVCSRAQCSSKNFWSMLDVVPQRTCTACVDEAKQDHEDFCIGSGARLPVMIVPGFASSVLEVHKSESKKHWEGHSVWVRIEELLKKVLDKAAIKIHKKSTKRAVAENSAEEVAESVSLESLDKDFASMSPDEHTQAALAATRLQRRFRMLNSSRMAEMDAAVAKAQEEADGELSDDTETAVLSALSFGTPTTTPAASPRRGRIRRVAIASSTTNARRKKASTGRRRATIRKQDTFTVERESTQDYLEKAHPLVRHLTLGRDGVSDPPGIRVRARKGLEAVMYLSNATVVKNKTFVFGKLVEHLFDMGYQAWRGESEVLPNDSRPAARRRTTISTFGLHKLQEDVDSAANGAKAPLISAAPYDWRISPRHLESRDGYFSDLKGKIETLYKIRGPVVLVGHSMGCMVTYYFLRWILWHELRQVVVANITSTFVVLLLDHLVVLNCRHFRYNWLLSQMRSWIRR